MTEIANIWMNQEGTYNWFIVIWMNKHEENIRHFLRAINHGKDYTWEEVDNAYWEIIEYLTEQFPR